MKKTAKIMLMSLLTIVACVSLISGATFALFTSSSEVNIAVTSGKVSVNATVDASSIQLYSYKQPEGGESVSTLQEGTNFAMGGTASFGDDGKSLSLDGIIPGDKATFNLNIVNESNVNIKYRYVVTVSGDAALYAALDVTLGSEEFTPSAFNGNVSGTAWKEWTVGADSELTVSISVELPFEFDDDGGEGTVQGKSCELSFAVNAIQGNAETSDEILTISNASELATFAKSVNNGTDYAGRTISLASSIDLSDEAWPVALSTIALEPAAAPWQSIGSEDHPFRGIFDGCGFTISGLTISGLRAGLFGVTEDATIRNLTIDGANITATDGGMGGILVGEAEGSLTVRNVHILGSAVQAVEGAENPTHVGAIVGAANGQVSVEDAEVQTESDSALVGSVPYDGLTTSGVTLTDESGEVKDLSCLETGLHDFRGGYEDYEYDYSESFCARCGAANPFTWDEDGIQGSDYIKENITDLVIPGMIDGRSVRLDTSAFQGYNNLNSVTLGEGITEISGSNYSYGWGAFKNCKNLHEVTMPSTLREIGEQAFYGCSYLEFINWPDDMGEFRIESEAFYGCSSLEYITIPEGCTYIGSEAFSHAELEQALVLPASLKSIGMEAFAYCELTRLDLSKTQITYLPEEAFYGNKYLEKVILPDCLTGIDSEVFRGCAFTDIVIPGSVTRIGSEALPSSLRTITFGSADKQSQITGTGSLTYCWNLERITFYGSMDKWNKLLGTGLTPAEGSGDGTVRVDIYTGQGHETVYVQCPED